MSDLYIRLKKLNIDIQLADGKLDIQAPKGVLNQELLNEIRSHKDELISFITTYSDRKDDYVPIRKVPPQESYPVSSSQRSLWIVSQFEEGNVGYNVSDVYIIKGKLNGQAFRSSFDALIGRHEILRTVFRESEAGAVRQYIKSPGEMSFAISEADLRNDSGREEKARTLVQQQFLQPFDLSSAPLFRAGLYRMDDDTWIFCYVMHHIISDGWSMDILMREVLLFYNSFTRGEAPLLPPLRIQYKDYAAWQQEQLSGEALKRHRDYWLEQFEGALPVLELPSDKPRPPIKTYNGDLVAHQMGVKGSTALKEICHQQGATLFMGLLAGVTALLYKYTGQEDIIIGTPIAGREHADLEGQIGFYVNTLALRTRFSPENNFAELLRNVKTVMLGAYEHQVFPFAELVEALQLQRDMSRNPLFDVQVALAQSETNPPEGSGGLDGLELTPYDSGGAETSRFDIVFNFKELHDDLQLDILYNTDIYSGETMMQLARHLGQLLSVLSEAPLTPLRQLDCLAGEEKRQLLEDFQGKTLEYDKDSTFLDLFAAQVQSVPDQLALSFEDVSLTYKELDGKANQLANYLLQEYALQPDDLVGIMMDRSDKMILALLAVQKAGAGYVPIEPDYPGSRKEFIIGDTGIKVLLTQSEYMFDVDYFQGGVFALDIQLDLLETPVSAPPVKVEPHHIAYVIYTSGSTGNPKGVLVEHRNLVHSTVPRLATYSGVESFLLLSSIAFDSSVAGVFGTLAAGGRLCITRKMDVGNVAALSDYIVRERVTHLLTVPSYYKLLLAELARIENNLRQVIVAGEACPAQLVEQHLAAEALQDCGLFNEYGPTEGTVWSTVHRYGRGEEFTATIGKPVPNCEVYILGNNNELLPAGVVGEICIAGGGLTRGYLNRPELTEQKFVSHPFKPGSRMYRTGDVGRWLRDGSIEFLGRKDDQVKIRGYRIELGEVENALRSHPSVEEAVVMARANEEHVKELAAYVVSGEPLTSSDLQSYLEKYLPSYAVPAHFVQLEKLPLTSNGKVDKKKLPDVKGAGMDSGMEYVAPRNGTEEKLALIWQGILEKERIGVRDRFFALGGDSIKILRMVAEVKKELDIQVPVADVYRHNTIEELVKHVLGNTVAIKHRNREAEELEARVKEEIAALKERILASGDLYDRGNIEDVYPMSDIERGMVFESLVNRSAGVFHDQMTRARYFPGFDIKRFRKAVQLVTDRHSILRTCFDMTSFDTEVQIVYRKVEVPVHYEDLSALPQQEQEDAVRRYMEAELANPFDVTRTPLWRAAAFNFGNDRIIFVFQCHHAIIDGWSDSLLMTELNNLYVELGVNPRYTPEPLKASYRDFIIQHEVDKRDPSIKKFWKDELSGYKRLDLFTEEPDLQSHARALDMEGRQKMEALAANLGVTIKEISLAAYLCMLRVLDQDSDVLAGLVTNTRPGCEDGDKILGCFLNAIPFRMNIGPDMECSELVRQVHDKIVALKENERVSLLQIAGLHSREAGQNPFFDTFFNFVDFHSLKSARSEIAAEPQAPAEVPIESVGRSNTYLDFTVNTTGNSYQAGLQLSRKLRSSLSSEALVDLYFRILEHIINNPSQAVGEVELHSAEEQNRLLEKFNDTAVDYPTDKTVIHLFEEQVQKTPGSTAVVFEDKELTYKELNERADQLAHYLLTNYAIAPGDLVAIKLERSERMIVALMGILKSGGAYLPIDPEYPQERIGYMISDSGCKVVIDEELLGSFSREQERYGKDNPPPVSLQPSSLAYVMYTSGSTGKPKGVMIEHRSMLNYLLGFQLKHRVDVDFLFTSNISFDASLKQIFIPLINGRKVHVYDLLRNLPSLPQYASGNKVKVLNATPGVINELLSLEDAANLFETLETIIIGGEAFDQALLKKLRSCNPQLVIINAYGPTETCANSLTCELDVQVSLGTPLPNTSVYLLDEYGKLVRAGVAGEICVGGDGLARGYLNNPELTAEKFVENPCRPGTRMYRTGDLGRWRPDGTIEFLGRKDDQVKIRGHRIELGEIENALHGIDAIGTAVVAAKEGSNGGKKLVAYIVAKQELATASIRSALSGVLPDFMIPSHFVLMEQLPLTANGKVDRNSLPNPEALETGAACLAPRNETEERLALLWSGILEIPLDKTGVKDSFFDLGGHSLKATRLLAKIEKEFGARLHIKDLFAEPTIEALAVKIERQLWVKGSEDAPQEKDSEMESLIF
jgi:amino acid adenylation domain-containing protein